MENARSYDVFFKLLLYFELHKRATTNDRVWTNADLHFFHHRIELPSQRIIRSDTPFDVKECRAEAESSPT